MCAAEIDSIPYPLTARAYHNGNLLFSLNLSTFCVSGNVIRRPPGIRGVERETTYNDSKERVGFFISVLFPWPFKSQMIVWNADSFLNCSI